MGNAYFLDADGHIGELFLYKEIDSVNDKVLILTGLNNGKEVWEIKPKKNYVLDDPKNLLKPKRVNGKWVEGMTQSELEQLKNAPIAKSEIEILREENAQLNLAIIELWETLV